MEPGRPQAGRRRQRDESCTLVIRGISAQARSQGGAYGNFVRRAPKGPLLALARAARWRLYPLLPKPLRELGPSPWLPQGIAEEVCRKVPRGAGGDVHRPRTSTSLSRFAEPPSRQLLGRW